MIGWPEVFYGGVVPGVVAAVVLAAVWQLTGRAASAWRTALVVGYVAGHWALDAKTIGLTATIVKSYRPAEARDWLPLLALLAIVPDALACVGKLGPAVGWLLRIALCVLVPWRLLYGSAYMPIQLPGLDLDLGGWSTGEAALWIGGIAGLLLAVWQLLRAAPPESTVSIRAALATVVALGSAVVGALSSSIVFGQQFGVFAATLAGCGLSSAVFNLRRGPEVAAGPIAILFGSLVTIAHFYAELKLHNGLLLVAATTLAIGWLPLPTKPSSNVQAAIRCVLCLVTLGTAVFLTAADYAATQTETESNPYQSSQPQPYLRMHHTALMPSRTPIFLPSS